MTRAEAQKILEGLSETITEEEATKLIVKLEEKGFCSERLRVLETIIDEYDDESYLPIIEHFRDEIIWNAVRDKLPKYRDDLGFLQLHLEGEVKEHATNLLRSIETYNESFLKEKQKETK